jgi:hypothetical protein
MNELERMYLLSDLQPEEILNLFRNRYYVDGNQTENGIVANALNDVLPRMTLLPCAVGQVVWFVAKKPEDKFYRSIDGIAACIDIRQAGETVIVRNDGTDRHPDFKMFFKFEDFGKKVFLTKEECDACAAKINEKVARKDGVDERAD